jgi:hypothetical protein
LSFFFLLNISAPSHPSKTGLETEQSSVSHLIAHRPPVPCNSRSHGLP